MANNMVLRLKSTGEVLELHVRTEEECLIMDVRHDLQTVIDSYNITDRDLLRRIVSELYVKEED